MAEKHQERRQDMRVTFRTLVRLQFPGGRIFSKRATNDISVSGLFVEDVTGVECGERCEVEFQLIGRTSTLVMELSAEVVRLGGNGVALQFFQVDQDSFCHLQNIVYFNFRQAGQLEEGGEIGVGAVEDETVYLDLGLAGRKAVAPEDEFGIGEDGDDDLEPEISERLSYAREED